MHYKALILAAAFAYSATAYSPYEPSHDNYSSLDKYNDRGYKKVEQPKYHKTVEKTYKHKSTYRPKPYGRKPAYKSGHDSGYQPKKKKSYGNGAYLVRRSGDLTPLLVKMRNGVKKLRRFGQKIKDLFHGRKSRYPHKKYPSRRPPHPRPRHPKRKYRRGELERRAVTPQASAVAAPTAPKAARKHKKAGKPKKFRKSRKSRKTKRSKKAKKSNK